VLVRSSVAPSAWRVRIWRLDVVPGPWRSYQRLAEASKTRRAGTGRCRGPSAGTASGSPAAPVEAEHQSQGHGAGERPEMWSRAGVRVPCRRRRHHRVLALPASGGSMGRATRRRSVWMVMVYPPCRSGTGRWCAGGWRWACWPGSPGSPWMAEDRPDPMMAQFRTRWRTSRKQQGCHQWGVATS